MKITVQQDEGMNIVFTLSEGRHTECVAVDRSMLTHTNQPAARLLLAVGRELSRAALKVETYCFADREFSAAENS